MCDELQHYVFIILCLLGCVDSEGVDPDDKPLVQVFPCVTKPSGTAVCNDATQCYELINLYDGMAPARSQKEVRQLCVTLGERCGQTAGKRFSLVKTCSADFDQLLWLQSTKTGPL